MFLQRAIIISGNKLTVGTQVLGESKFFGREFNVVFTIARDAERNIFLVEDETLDAYLEEYQDLPTPLSVRGKVLALASLLVRGDGTDMHALINKFFDDAAPDQSVCFSNKGSNIVSPAEAAAPAVSVTPVP